MPWSEEDVASHNEAASKDETKRHQWVSVANHVLSETGDDARAIRTANAAVADDEPASEPAKDHKSRTMRRPGWRWAKDK